jgi:signal transduction histidine kinase
VNDKLKEMSGMLDEAVRAVRKVASDLRPSILDDFGLIQALDWHGIEFSKRSGITVQFRHPEVELIINSDITIGLFRIYQEVLTNVARHAEAKNVTTILDCFPDHLQLTITDDGKGFDTNKTQKSLGLLGMRERAYIIGGTVIVNSAPGIGTTVIVTVPLVTTVK